MTYLAKDIRDHLAGSAEILNAFSDRMYADVIPQQSAARSPRVVNYPCIVINDISAEPEMYLGGEAGKHTSQVQIDVWTDGTGGKERANDYRELVRNRLSGYRGQFGTGCYGTARLLRDNSLAAPPIDGSDKHRRRVSMDFEIIHSADVPTFT